MINDGNKDSSLTIAKEFESQHPSVFHVIDKKNGNYGSCINRGLQEARGKYIKILDADDSFDSKGLEEVLEVLKTTDVDLLVSDFETVNEEGAVQRVVSFDIPADTILNASDYIGFFNSLQMHAVVYRTENLKNIHYQQTEGISYTDQEWVFSPLTTVRQFIYLNKVVYKYLVGRAGQTVELSTYHNKVKDRVKMIRNMVEWYEHYFSENSSPTYIPFLNQRMLELIHSVYLSYLIVNRDPDGANEFDIFLKNFSPRLYDESRLLTVHKYLPLKYVERWRKSNKLPNKFLSVSYKRLKGIK